MNASVTLSGVDSWLAGAVPEPRLCPPVAVNPGSHIQQVLGQAWGGWAPKGWGRDGWSSLPKPALLSFLTEPLYLTEYSSFDSSSILLLQHRCDG